MIDQKIVQVDTRGILRDLMMRLAGESYAREFQAVGKFIDNNHREIFQTINAYYQMELSHGKDQTMAHVQHRIEHLVTTYLCQYFPQMGYEDMRHACQLFLEVLTTGYNSRVPPNLGVWDSCAIRELSSDSYVIICSRQTAEPLSAAGRAGLFIQPINAGSHV